MNPGAALHDKLTQGGTAFGTWVSLAHPSIAEMMCKLRVDFLGIDLEHSTISQTDAQRIIAAAHAAGQACLPRIASHNFEAAKRNGQDVDPVLWGVVDHAAAYARDAAGPGSFAKVARHESNQERSWFRNLHELQRIQLARKAGVPVQPPPEVDVNLTLGTGSGSGK